MTAFNPLSPSEGLVGGDDVLNQMKRHEIEVLHRAGFSLREVAKKAHVSRGTVRRILRPSESDDDGRRPVGRPSVAVPFRGAVFTLLQERPDLPTAEVLRLLRQRGYSGSPNPVYELVRDLRKVVVAPLVRFEGLPGEFSQNDFGSVRLRYEDGTEEIPHFFAARLKWSRWVHVQIVPNEREEALVRALLASFESFGGVPLACVFDNPKTIVLSRYGNTIQWNPTFAQVALDYRFAAELCSPRRGNEKGSVENLVGFVKKNFFLARRFHDREEVLLELPGWLREVNRERPCRATKLIPLARIEEERKRLRPLSTPPAEYALRFPVRIGPTAEVSFQGVRYSMPAEAMGLNATLFLYPDRVRIMTDRFDEVHPRQPFNGVSTLPKHATSALAAVAGRRAQLYYRRQRLLEVGSSAERFLTEVIHAHPRTWAGDVEQLFELLLLHGPEVMDRGFQRALERGWFEAGSIERWLRTEVVA